MFFNRNFLLLMALSISGIVAGDSVESQLKDLKNAYIKQQKEMALMRQQIKDMESLHSEAIQKYIKDEIAQQVSHISLSKHVQGLKIKGDLRLRYQSEDNHQANGDDKRERFRQRLRIGAEWQTVEGWLIGVGIATGDENGASTNDTYGDEGTWDSGDIRLDYAYAKHNWAFKGGVQTVILGKMKTPFFTSKAFFDSDYIPSGVAHKLDFDSLFITTGVFTVQQNNNGRNENDTMLYALQMGVKNDLFKAAMAYYHYNNTDYDNGDGNFILLEDDEVRLFDLIAELYIKASDFKMTPYGQYSFNSEADEDDQAFMLGVKTQMGDLSIATEYRYMEANAVPSIIMDSDFIGGANREGVVLSTQYKLSKNLSAGLKLYVTEEINDTKSDKSDDEKLWQADLVYKF